MSAVVSRELITICWLGDSRAYWLAAEGLARSGPNDTIDITGGSRRITRDDSLAEEMVAAGLASMDDAMASPQAHVITRWLGADLPDPLAHIEQFTPTGPGVLLVCSDGLWNYRQEAAELAVMAMPAALERPLDAAADLVKFAIDSGGLDNIIIAEDPGLQQLLRDERHRIPNFVEETLRMESPVKGDFRLSRVPATIGDVQMPAGTTVMLLNAAANRDHEFKDPGRVRHRPGERPAPRRVRARHPHLPGRTTRPRQGPRQPRAHPRPDERHPDCGGAPRSRRSAPVPLRAHLHPPPG